MAEDENPSRYVKLNKEHDAPLEEIQPGELNQPVAVSQELEDGLANKVLDMSTKQKRATQAESLQFLFEKERGRQKRACLSFSEGKTIGITDEAIVGTSGVGEQANDKIQVSTSPSKMYNLQVLHGDYMFDACSDRDAITASMGRDVMGMGKSNTTCGKQLGLEEETVEREREMEGVDVVDLPSFDDEICSFEQEEELNWDPGEEEEKACSDRTSNATNRCHRFSRVYDVNTFKGKTHVPKKYKPVHGSPSSHIKKDPFLMSGPIQSTRRIRVTFEDQLSKCQKILHGTAFSLSPKVGCTARHCLFKDGMDVSAIDICEGSHVSNRTFDSAGHEGTLLGVSTQQFSKAKDQGLFISGADVGMFSISKGTFKSFLLPCSPSFLSVSQCNKVAIPSYPGVENMLQKAKDDLKRSNTSATWKAYKPAMEKDITDEFQKLAALQQMKGKSKSQIMRVVLKNIKQVLYDDLIETFHGFSNGDMLCAVGSMTAWNDVSIANTCSTLRGSSGGPLCVFGLVEYFFAIHSGGICGFDQNGATSCNNPEFVKMYMGHVLPTLPRFHSQIWKNVDMRGFIHWLNLHIDEIPQDSPWLAKALQMKKKMQI